MRFALLFVVVACGKSADKAPPATKLDKLNVVVHGAPLAVDRAFIKRASPDVFTVLVGAGKGSCEALLAGTEAGSGKSVSFTITKRVGPAGHENFMITDVWSRDFDVKVELPVKVKLEGDGNQGAVAKLAVSLRGPGLELDGSFDATGCGETRPTGMGVPKTTHTSKGTITIANKVLDIKGVTVSTRAGVAPTDLPNITISTNVKDCSSVTVPAPVILERLDTKWSLRGTWFEQPIQGDDAAAGLAFTANDVGKGPDGPTLDLQLSGSGKIGDYSVKLAGTAEAIECVR